MCYSGQCIYEDYFGDCRNKGPCIHPEWWEQEDNEEEQDEDEDEDAC